MIMQENNTVQAVLHYKVFEQCKAADDLKIPQYLQETYWLHFVLHQ